MNTELTPSWANASSVYADSEPVGVNSTPVRRYDAR